MKDVFTAVQIWVHAMVTGKTITDATLDLFVKETDAALLTLNEQKIRANHRKWSGQELPTNPFLFWGAILKAITGRASLPIEFRQQAKDWLSSLGLQSHDDGDLKDGQQEEI